MKRVLLISYYYPPMPAVGGLRARGLARYLPEFGWEVVVLHGPTESKGGIVHKLLKIDPNQNLLAQAQELQRKLGGLPVQELLKLYAEWFKYPDASPSEGWTQSDCWEYGYDAVVSTSSPVRCHLLAAQAKRDAGLPWIADFRDLWTQNHYYPYSRIRKHFEEKLELRTLDSADALTTVSMPLVRQLSALHGKPAHSVPNGYDPGGVNDGSTPVIPGTVTYTGTIYPGKQSVKELTKHIAQECPRATYRFYGPYSKELEKAAREDGVDGAITQYGVVSREEALHRQRESDRLLLLKWQGAEGVITTKVFEYMAARRPILAIGPPSTEVDLMLAEAKADRIEQYSQREMARKFAEVLEGVVADVH